MSKQHSKNILNSQPIILASTSSFRSALLSTLQIPFETDAPNIDETPLHGEDARSTSLRLSKLKAQAVASKYPRALIIGSDQVALVDGVQLGKPLTHENAVRQLQLMRGKTTQFYTALSLLNAATGNMQSEVVITEVSYRQLSDAEIERYLLKEQPYHCAGSAKCEGLGIALTNRIRGDDPNALIGLPLISLVTMLKNQGVDVI